MFFYGCLCHHRCAVQIIIHSDLYKKKLTMTPTPVHRWNLPGLPEGFEVSIKREDLIGSTLSGNKVKDKLSNIPVIPCFMADNDIFKIVSSDTEARVPLGRCY